jgi:membrane protease YdiL (CAAX protease family)
MFQRFLQFVPSILAIAVIATAAFFAFKMLARHWKVEKWSVVEFKENIVKRLVLAFLSANVFAPFSEELVFRGPLVIFFSSLTGHAWIAICVSAALFAAGHLTNPTFISPAEITKKEDGDLVEAVKEARTEMPGWQKKAQKISQVISTFVLGTVSGYLAVLKQSIWIAVAFHFAWNFIGPLIIMFIVIAVCYIGIGIYYLFEAICNRFGLSALQGSVLNGIEKLYNHSKKSDK